MVQFVKPVVVLLTIACSSFLAGQQKPIVAPKAETPWREKLVKNTGAPVKIIEFFDYQCPYCAETIPGLEEALKNHAGQVQLILKNVPLSIHPDSLLAHEAALAAAEQGKFWEMHDLLFAHQKKVKLPDLLAYAAQLHLDLPLFRERLQSGHYRPAIDQDVALAASLGVDGTPTFFVNGQKTVGAQTAAEFNRAIGAILDPGAVAANGNGGKNKSVQEIDLTHAPVRGNSAASVTIIEFSDLQCPFCARALPGLEQVVEKYPGQVRWVFKNFPLSMHNDAQLAHLAALAAGEQGKFWEMHDLILSDQKAMKRQDLLEKARSLKLDITRFTSDLADPELKRRMEADMQDGVDVGVSGTPTFFINGKEYSGAPTLEEFRAAIEKDSPSRLALAAPSSPHITPADSEITMGPGAAPITLVWFSDLESNLTLKATLLVRQLMSTYPGKIRVIFRNRPLDSHPNAQLMHEAALAANAQGKFWEMHDLIVATPQKTSLQDLMSYAQRLGLDADRFRSEIEGHKYLRRIESDLQEARRRSILGSPVFFLNSTRIDGLQPQKMFDDLIAEQLSRVLQASSQ